MSLSHWKGWHTLSSKLLLLFIGMAVLFVFLVGSGIRHTFKSHFEDNIRPHITQYLEYVQKDIGSPPDRERARVLADRLNIEIQIFDDAGSWSSAGQPLMLEKLEIEHRINVRQQELYVAESTDDHYLMVRDGAATLLFNVPDIRHERESSKGIIPLLILLAVLFVLYAATRRLIAPIDVIRDGVSRFGTGDIQHRITLERNDELGVLADSFNTMADDIQQMLDSKRQLLLAISHELRSPLTRARISVEMLDDRIRKQQLTDEINEMESLIAELMETERLSHRHSAINPEPHDIVRLIHELVNDSFGEDAVETRLPERDVVLSLDVARVRLMLKNLLENAVRYSPDESVPTVSIRLIEGAIEVSVQDQGQGIAPEHLPYLTEPFYRVDPSRQRETGGYGLGLYLCRVIAEAHGGSLVIDSELEKGTLIRVCLPR